jgi:hypothetical protein
LGFGHLLAGERTIVPMAGEALSEKAGGKQRIAKFFVKEAVPPLFASFRLKLFGYSYPIEITVIRDNLIPLNLNDSSSLEGDGASGRFTAVGPFAGIGPFKQPMMGDQPRLDFTSIKHLEMKIGESCPQSLYICGKSFSANAGMGVRIAKGSIFGESGNKRVGITAIPGIVIAAGYFGGFHSRNLASSLCGVERELKQRLLSCCFPLATGGKSSLRIRSAPLLSCLFLAVCHHR